MEQIASVSTIKSLAKLTGYTERTITSVAEQIEYDTEQICIVLTIARYVSGINEAIDILNEGLALMTN